MTRTTRKATTAFVCSECGADYGKWQGQCGECGAWNTISEIVLAPGSRRGRASGGRGGGWTGASDNQVVDLSQVSDQEQERTQTGIGELDRVLVGGRVAGAVVLVGGDPGIGKSTLLLQAVASMAASLTGLYITGEESLAQVAARGRRLDLELSGLRCLAETHVERIVQLIGSEKPGLVVIDSIQTMYAEAVTSAPGSVSQVRESAALLVRAAKATGTIVFLVGHVTKEGGIAGPRVLEHMVDAVLYFEGESGSRYRVLRAFKNRFGAVNELGVFAMGTGAARSAQPSPSSQWQCRASRQRGNGHREGTRPLLVEVQALVDQSPLANPRRVPWPGRMAAMLRCAPPGTVITRMSRRRRGIRLNRRRLPVRQRCASFRNAAADKQVAFETLPAAASGTMARNACAKRPRMVSIARSCPGPMRPAARRQACRCSRWNASRMPWRRWTNSPCHRLRMQPGPCGPAQGRTWASRIAQRATPAASGPANPIIERVRQRRWPDGRPRAQLPPAAASSSSSWRRWRLWKSSVCGSASSNGCSRRR